MTNLLKTGIPGFDELVNGGLPQGHVYMIRGEPGTGKTTMALQFLAEGKQAGESGLYFTLSQTGEELRAIAAVHGIDLTGIDVEDASGILRAEQSQGQTVLLTDEQELDQILTLVTERLRTVRPSRVVLDSLIELRLRSADILRFRQLVRRIMQILVESEGTALLLDSDPEFGGDSQVTALVHGVISLQRARPGFGISQRQLEINKMRAVNHAEGTHDYMIKQNGVHVYPRLSNTEESGGMPTLKTMSTGLGDLDELLGGGLDEGTSVLIYGQSGVGKSTISAVLCKAAITRNGAAACFLFEEHPKLFVRRADGVGLGFSQAIETGKLYIRDLQASEVLPGAFVHEVLSVIREKQLKIVVIDSINGYLAAAARKDHALAQLTALLYTLRSQKVISVLVAEQAGLLHEPHLMGNLSILADTVIMIRQYEALATIRRTISILKRRTGPHSTEMRELRLRPGRIEIRPISKADLGNMREVQLLSSHGP